MKEFKITKLLDAETRTSCFCAVCGTDKSVKYLVTVESQKGKKATVCCCNKCVAAYNRVINKE